MRTNTPITITSFVTRIASNLGVLVNAQIEYIPNDMSHFVGEHHFIQGHFLRADAKGNLIMTYFGHKFEVLLPAPHLDLYKVASLTMQLDVEPPRASFAGVMTHGQMRAATRQQGEGYESGAGPSRAP